MVFAAFRYQKAAKSRVGVDVDANLKFSPGEGGEISKVTCKTPR
jgi:hypothetical protein